MEKKPKTKTDVAMENAQEQGREAINQAAAAAGGVPGSVVSAGNPGLERETYTSGEPRNPMGPGEDAVEVVRPKR